LTASGRPRRRDAREDARALTSLIVKLLGEYLKNKRP